MRSFLLFFLLLMFITVLYPACTKSPAPETGNGSYEGLKQLDWQTVSRFLDEFNQVFQTRNIDFFEKHMSDETEIVIEQNGKKAKVDKKKYMEVLTEAWKKIEEYEFTHTKPEIVISDNAANVHLIVTEKGKVMDRSIESVSDTTIELLLVDGKITIRSVKGKSRMTMKKAESESKDPDSAKKSKPDAHAKN